MASRQSDIRVGLAVLAAAAILIVGLLWINDFRLTRSHSTIDITFTQVGGLQTGDVVQVNGVDAGDVTHIALEGDSVRVQISLHDHVRIGRHADAVIRDRGMMGQKFILIRTRAGDTPLPAGGQLAGRFDAGLAEVMAMTGATLERMEGLTGEIERMLHTGQDGHDMQRAIENLSVLTRDLRATVSENRDDMRTAVRGMKSSAVQMDALLRENSGKVGGALDATTATATRLDSLAVQLTGLSASLRTVTGEVAAGRGTMGRMVYDDSLYVALSRTVNDASDLVSDILEHPKKYFKFSLF